MGGGRKVHVRDLFLHEGLGASHGEFVADINLSDFEMFIVKKVE